MGRGHDIKQSHLVGGGRDGELVREIITALSIFIIPGTDSTTTSSFFTELKKLLIRF